MARKRKRRKQRRNFVAFGWRIDALPGPVKKSVVFSTLIRIARTGHGALPRGWRVMWRWQNTPKGKWREGSFGQVVRASSRGGFRQLMVKRLERDRGRNQA